MAKDEWCKKHTNIRDDFATGDVDFEGFKTVMKELGFNDAEILDDVREINEENNSL